MRGGRHPLGRDCSNASRPFSFLWHAPCPSPFRTPKGISPPMDAEVILYEIRTAIDRLAAECAGTHNPDLAAALTELRRDAAWVWRELGREVVAVR